MHAAAICLGTIKARTHVQLALACQHSMIRAQHRLRLTMQHVFGHGGHFGNECADHAAALCTFGLISSHNVATRWIRRNFDTSVCFDGCNNISETLGTIAAHSNRCNVTSSKLELALFSSSGLVCFLCTSRNLWSFVSFALSFFPLGSCFLNQVMDRLSSSASTVPSIDNNFEHNVWNPLLELLFFEQANGIFASFLMEIDLAKIALLSLCYVTRRRCMPLHDDTMGTAAQEFLLFL